MDNFRDLKKIHFERQQSLQVCSPWRDSTSGWLLCRECQRSPFDAGCLEPSIELLDKVFPDVTRSLIAHSDEANASGVETTATSMAILEALQYLRKVFLQDSVLREQCSELRLWTHDLFKSQGFITFADDPKKATTRREVVNPATSRLHPDAKAYLDTQNKYLYDGQVQLIQHITTETASALNYAK